MLLINDNIRKTSFFAKSMVLTEDCKNWPILCSALAGKAT